MKLSRKISRSKAPRKMTNRTNARMGIIFAMTIMVLMVTASWTPPITKNVKSQTTIEAQMIDARLLPPAKIGMNWPSAANSKVAKDTCDKMALIQYPQAELNPT